MDLPGRSVCIQTLAKTGSGTSKGSCKVSYKIKTVRHPLTAITYRVKCRSVLYSGRSAQELKKYYRGDSVQPLEYSRRPHQCSPHLPDHRDVLGCSLNCRPHPTLPPMHRTSDKGTKSIRGLVRQRVAQHVLPSLLRGPATGTVTTCPQVRNHFPRLGQVSNTRLGSTN